jgi:hypothetical protein
MQGRWLRLLGLACAMLVGNLSPVSAQVLIWNIPETDGAWIRFEGTYRQTQARPNVATGDALLEWRQELTISSVGGQEGEYQGRTVPCRWIEFKSVTKPAGVDQPPGPGGVILYKVLVPVEAVIGKPVDGESVPVTFLPVLEGLRKVGDRPVEKVQAGALAVYPHISQLTYYPDLAPVSNQAEEITVAGESVPARVNKGKRELQDNRSRSVNSATLWLSDKLPFGLAKFTVNVERDQKLPTAPIDDFRRVTVIDVEMTAVEVGQNARSEIAAGE